MPTAETRGAVGCGLSKGVADGVPGDDFACDGAGTGGAFWSSHFLWTSASLSLSWKVFSPPSRNDNLMLSVTSVLTIRACWKNGAGESARFTSLLSNDEAPFGDNGAPHISHSISEGWLTKVHRGQDTEPLVAESCFPLLFEVFSSGIVDVLFGRGVSLLAAALIAAFNTVVKGGLIPHARQGGRCVAAVAVAGSKFDGTGFEKVHIGQIQVALMGFGDGDGDAPGCTSGWRVDCWGTAGLEVVLRDLSVLLFCGFGYIVTLGDDFRKRA